MKFQIVEIEERANGKLYKIEVDSFRFQLLMTWHSIERIAIWNLNIEQVLEAMIFPDEVVTGHFNRFIAHKRHNKHLIRAVYEYDMNLPVLVTVYYPSTDRYYEGGEKFADKILP